MTPATCPYCWAGPDPVAPTRYWACGTSHAYPSGRQTRCHEREANTLRARVIDTERQLSDALARVAVLEEADRSNNASIGMFRARVRELEGRNARLVEAGDGLFQIAEKVFHSGGEDMHWIRLLEDELSEWKHAKEAKP